MITLTEREKNILKKLLRYYKRFLLDSGSQNDFNNWSLFFVKEGRMMTRMEPWLILLPLHRELESTVWT